MSKKHDISLISIIFCGLVFLIFTFLGLFLSSNVENVYYVEAMKYVTVIALVVSGLVTLVEFISLFFDKTALFETLLLAIGVSLFVLFSKDFLSMIGVDLSNTNLLLTFEIFQIVAFYFIIFSTIRYFRRDYHVEVDKRYFIVFYTAILIFLTLQIIFVIFDIRLNIVALFTILLTIVSYAVICIAKKRETDITFAITSALLFTISGTYLSKSIVLLIPNMTYAKGIDSIAGVTIELLFISVYLFFVIRTARKAYQNEAYQKKIAELEVIALEEQINPHFVFNSLNLIKSIYRQDTQKGDRAVELLSKHLRTNVDIKSGGMIVPLKDELKNVECFVELSNMGNARPIEIIYDIDADDFVVPVLGIEPLVENSIKYSQIQTKEDGYIKISTRENDNEYIIDISDNGVGFNLDEVKEKSKGIKNVKERFEIMLNAKMEIDSKIGEGSRTIITIPKKK